MLKVIKVKPPRTENVLRIRCLSVFVFAELCGYTNYSLRISSEEVQKVIHIKYIMKLSKDFFTEVENAFENKNKSFLCSKY